MDAEPAQDAAEAFEGLRAEVALLRRALEGLSAERNALPDYGPTLEKLVMRQDKVGEVLRHILQAPAVQVTHEAFGASVERMSTQARREDRATIEHAANLLRSAASQLAFSMETARSAAVQRDALIWTAVLAMGGTAVVLALARIVVG